MIDKHSMRRRGLPEVLWSFRREFLIVGVFSMVVNLLMLTPTVYMLQVFDRVMVSQSHMTLLMVSLLTLFFLESWLSRSGCVPFCWCAREFALIRR